MVRLAAGRLAADLALQFSAGTPVAATFDDVATACAWQQQIKRGAAGPEP